MEESVVNELLEVLRMKLRVIENTMTDEGIKRHYQNVTRLEGKYYAYETCIEMIEERVVRASSQKGKD